MTQNKVSIQILEIRYFQVSTLRSLQKLHGPEFVFTFALKINKWCLEIRISNLEFEILDFRIY